VKLTGPQLVKNPHSVDPDGSLTHSQALVPRPCPEPNHEGEKFYLY
jgi:hypothetical protein